MAPMICFLKRMYHFFYALAHILKLPKIDVGYIPMSTANPMFWITVFAILSRNVHILILKRDKKYEYFSLQLIQCSRSHWLLSVQGMCIFWSSKGKKICVLQYPHSMHHVFIHWIKIKLRSLPLLWLDFIAWMKWCDHKEHIVN